VNRNRQIGSEYTEGDCRYLFRHSHHLPPRENDPTGNWLKEKRREMNFLKFKLTLLIFSIPAVFISSVGVVGAFSPLLAYKGKRKSEFKSPKVFLYPLPSGTFRSSQMR